MSEGEATAEHGLEEVLSYLKESRGFDFTGYKRTSLMRRVRHRMNQIGIGDYGDYIDQLQVNPDEFSALFNTTSSTPTASSSRPTKNCNPPTRSWKPRTRNCSPRSRSWRPPTRSSSRPTRNWRR